MTHLTDKQREAIGGIVQHLDWPDTVTQQEVVDEIQQVLDGTHESLQPPKPEKREPFFKKGMMVQVHASCGNIFATVASMVEEDGKMPKAIAQALETTSQVSSS